jgi:hypothetical protein
MHRISHRGNVKGPNEHSENSPRYIEEAINLGFDCEVDIHYFAKTHEIYLGHDSPQYPVDFKWLLNFKEKLWIHCKNSEAMEFFATSRPHFNFFWHQKDDFTLTSFGYIWVYPGINPTAGSILVLPENIEIGPNDLEFFPYIGGICSDYISRY